MFSRVRAHDRHQHATCRHPHQRPAPTRGRRAPVRQFEVIDGKLTVIEPDDGDMDIPF
jgi:hypothetical protein